MLQQFYSYPRVLTRVRGGAFGADVEALATYLAKRGNSPVTIRLYLSAVEHLGFILTTTGLRFDRLTEEEAHAAIASHSACRCPAPRTSRRFMSAVIPHLLVVLRRRRRVPPRLSAPVTPLDRLLNRFRQHLEKNRGAASATCDRLVRDVRTFAAPLSRSGRFTIETVSARDVRDHVVARATAHSSRTGKQSATAIRTFLRFLELSGADVAPLQNAVPIVRDPKVHGLPKALSETQLRALLGSFKETPAGLRDRAMALCMAHLGLRAKEVAELRLKSVDWRASTLTLFETKGGRPLVLPLTDVVGRSIARYLEQGRPRGRDTEHLFLRHFMPVGQAVNSHVVSSAVREAFERAQLDIVSRGAHALRHTAATRLVRAGVPIKHVADLLGHLSIDTTSIYVKVDIERLGQVALPWPGGAR